jgi:hypothetical protein
MIGFRFRVRVAQVVYAFRFRFTVRVTQVARVYAM